MNIESPHNPFQAPITPGPIAQHVQKPISLLETSEWCIAIVVFQIVMFTMPINRFTILAFRILGGYSFFHIHAAVYMCIGWPLGRRCSTPLSAAMLTLGIQFLACFSLFMTFELRNPLDILPEDYQQLLPIAGRSAVLSVVVSLLAWRSTGRPWKVVSTNKPRESPQQ
jgi:hypothetical protein